MRSLVRGAVRYALAAFAAAVLGGCFASGGGMPNPFAEQATPQQQAVDTDPMLQAAGFDALPATTPQQIAQLKSLPALQMGNYIDANGVAHYWMADPDSCNCLFHGDEAAYQRYENIKLQNQMAERDRQAIAAQQYQQQQMMMGPGLGFGGPGLGFGGPGFGMMPGYGYGSGFSTFGGFGGPGIGFAF